MVHRVGAFWLLIYVMCNGRGKFRHAAHFWQRKFKAISKITQNFDRYMQRQASDGLREVVWPVAQKLEGTSFTRSAAIEKVNASQTPRPRSCSPLMLFPHTTQGFLVLLLKKYLLGSERLLRDNATPLLLPCFSRILFTGFFLQKCRSSEAAIKSISAVAVESVPNTCFQE